MHVRLTHHTPSHRPSWRWIFMYPLATISGPTETITGQTVIVDPPITAWTGFVGMPEFKTRAEAIAWAEDYHFAYDSCEI